MLKMASNTFTVTGCTARYGCAAWRRVFDTATFKSDLKEVLRTAGIEGTPVLLSLEERHLATDTGRHGTGAGYMSVSPALRICKQL